MRHVGVTSSHTISDPNKLKRDKLFIHFIPFISFKKNKHSGGTNTIAGLLDVVGSWGQGPNFGDPRLPPGRCLRAVCVFLVNSSHVFSLHLTNQ